MDWKIKRAEKGLKGEISVNADKSISHRAIMFGALAEGTCRIENFLFAEDCMRTFDAFRAMGIDITKGSDGAVTVKGKGIKGLSAPKGDLYLGNSGTTMRILSGILSGQDFSVKLSGDGSLSNRPMNRVIDPLRLMGADIRGERSGGYPPLIINGRGAPLTPVFYKMPIASAQVKSCVLSAGLFAEGETVVREPFQSRDHTERMLEYFSADITRDGLKTSIRSSGKLIPGKVVVPGDISSAAFFIVAALIVEGSSIVLRDVGLNPTRIGILNVLKRMGGDIKILDLKDSYEPRGDLAVKFSDLTAAEIKEDEIPLLIDEIPILVIAALRAQGDTLIKGIGELRVKETDRVESLTSNLLKAGLSIRETKDEIIVPGKKNIISSEFDSFGDHRIAMSMAIAAIISEKGCSVTNASCADTSYPDFLKDLHGLLDP